MDNMNGTRNWFLDQLTVFQSANSDYQSIKNNFIIRKTEFSIIIDSILNKKAKDPLQHELILGRRGSGKSTLLKRIEVELAENPKLNKKYIAINLAEEQAGIYRLFDLWEQVLEELKHQTDIEISISEYSSAVCSSISMGASTRSDRGFHSIPCGANHRLGIPVLTS